MAYPFDNGDKYQIGTVQAGKMPSAETNATFFIDLSSLSKAGTDIWDTCRSDGGDIRVTTGDGATQIARCILCIDTTAETGVIAINAPSLDVGSTVRIYYNGTATEPTAVSTYGSENAWDSTYDGAYFHGNYTVDTSIADATGNGRNLTFNGVDLYTYYYDSKQTGGPSDHESCFYDGSNYYFSDSNTLRKRPTFNSAVGETTNTDPCGDVDTDQGSGTRNHLGSIYVDGTYVWVVVESWTDCGTNSAQVIARFLKSNLSFDDSWDISAQGHEASGLCIDTEAGTNGTIYVSDYCANEIHKYDLATPSTHLGDITLTNTAYMEGSTAWQSICQDGDEFILSRSTDICWVDSAGDYIGQRAKLNDGGFSTGQNVFKYGNDLYWWDGDNYELAKISPIRDVVTASSLGHHIFIGNGNDSYNVPGDDCYAQATYTPGDVGTLQYIFKPRAYYNYNAVYDTNDGVDVWEGWCYSDGRLSNRIGTSRIYDLDNIGDADTIYFCGLGWTHTTTVDTALIVDGSVRASGTETWNAPSTLFNWNGEGGGNQAGSGWFYYMAFRNIDLAKDPDRLTSEYNNQSSPDTFWSFGDEQTVDGSSLLPIKFNIDEISKGVGPITAAQLGGLLVGG